ncbi:MAG: hypothetical protein HDR44_01545 [Allobaculum sp.]|nr:hypothetical protein [Allobaculum sp.]
MQSNEKAIHPEEKMASIMDKTTSPSSYCVSPDPALQFVFGMFGLMTWISTVVSMNPDAMFVKGVLQVCLGVAAFAGSCMNLRRGDPHGNVNLILSVILGFAFGITSLAPFFGSHIHTWLLSTILLAGSVYMACFLPLLGDAPIYIWGEHIFVCLGLFSKSLSDILSLSILGEVGAWLLLGFALLALYQGISDMYALCGRHLPQGPRMPKGK